MSFYAKDLKYRGQIKKAINTPVSGSAKLSRTYETITTIWIGLKSINYAEFIRSQEIGDILTHEMLMRKASVELLGIGMTPGFDSGFNSIADINMLKSDYFIFIEGATANRGRLFRIKGLQLDENNREYVKIKVQEIEEKGTGGAA